MGFQLHYLSVHEFGEGSETGIAKSIGELDKDIDELVELALRMPIVQSFISVVVELFKDGQLAFTGEGMEEIGIALEFSGPVIIDAVEVFEGGQQVEEDEDLFFGEDALILTLCAGLDGGLDVDLGGGEGVVDGGWSGGSLQKGRIADPVYGLQKCCSEILVRVGQEVV